MKFLTIDDDGITFNFLGFKSSLNYCSSTEHNFKIYLNIFFLNKHILEVKADTNTTDKHFIRHVYFLGKQVNITN